MFGQGGPSRGTRQWYTNKVEGVNAEGVLRRASNCARRTAESGNGGPSASGNGLRSNGGPNPLPFGGGVSVAGTATKRKRYVKCVTTNVKATYALDYPDERRPLLCVPAYPIGPTFGRTT